MVPERVVGRTATVLGVRTAFVTMHLPRWLLSLCMAVIVSGLDLRPRARGRWEWVHRGRGIPLPWTSRVTPGPAGQRFWASVGWVTLHWRH